MDRLGLSEDDLEREDNVIKLAMKVFAVTGRDVEGFEAALEEGKGENPQWDADALRAVLQRAVEPHGGENVAYLGITSVDIYAGDYNFLFGWAGRLNGVMSYSRLTSEFNDEIPNRERLFERAYKQSLASAGHVFGIDRCTDPGCARAYPHSLSEHDAKNTSLCSECRAGFRDEFAGVCLLISRDLR